MDFDTLLSGIHQKRTRIPLNEDEMILLLIEKIVSRSWKPQGGFTNLVYHPQGFEERIESILVIQLSSIGDVVYSSPAFLGLRDRFPDARIVLLTGAGPAKIAYGNPSLDEVRVFDFERYREDLLSGAEVSSIFLAIKEDIMGLRKERFCLSVNVSVTPQSAYINTMVEAKSWVGLGVDRHGEPVMRGSPWVPYVYYIKCNREMEDLNRLNLVELHLRMAGVNPVRREVFIPSTVEACRKAEEIYRAAGISSTDTVVGLVPGSNFRAKQWGETAFSRIGERIVQELGAKVVIFGGRKERELTRVVANGMQTESLDLGGKVDLSNLSAFLIRCSHLVTNDTGPMHIAGGVGVKCVVVSGPTRYGPYGKGDHFILQSRLDCVNCGGTTSCKRRDCMDAISPDVVFEVLRYQMGLRETLPESDNVNIFHSGHDEFGRFSLYVLINRREGDLDPAKEILKLISLNLWIEEGWRFGYDEDPLSFDEAEKELLRQFTHYEIQTGVRDLTKRLIAQEELYKRGAELLQKAFINGDLTYQEELSTITSKMYQGIGRILSLYNLIFLRGTEEHDPIVYRRLGLYEKKREACAKLRGLLHSWK